MKSLKNLALSTMFGAVLVFTAACGAGDNATNENTENQAEQQLSGEIAIDGSSTVFPILEAVSEEYGAVQPDVKAPVGVSGTGGGFKRFVVGETDLSNASRPIKEEETKLAEENGVEFIELPLAYDGLSVLVNPENDWVDHLTVDELKKMWTDSSVTLWSDIRPEWPKEKIEFFSPGFDSGTYDYWDEVILDGGDIRKDAQMSEDDHVLVTGVSGSKNGIAYFGYAYYIENKDKVKIVPIDGGEGPVEPSEETINNGTYAPLSREIYTYVNKKSLQRPEVLDFITFTNENAGDLSLEVGYINLPKEKYEENKTKIEEAAK